MSRLITIELDVVHNGTPAAEEVVKITAGKESAEQLFHDINRMLSLLDEAAVSMPSTSDQNSYTRLNVLANKLARAITPKQEKA